MSIAWVPPSASSPAFSESFAACARLVFAVSFLAFCFVVAFGGWFLGVGLGGILVTKPKDERGTTKNGQQEVIANINLFWLIKIKIIKYFNCDEHEERRFRIGCFASGGDSSDFESDYDSSERSPLGSSLRIVAESLILTATIAPFSKYSWVSEPRAYCNHNGDAGADFLKGDV
jgi:hypothetical protein